MIHARPILERYTHTQLHTMASSIHWRTEMTDQIRK